MKLLKDQRGVGELVGGMVAIFFMSLTVVAIIVIMQAWNVKLATQQAAFEAARAGIVSDTPVQTAQTVAKNFASGLIPNWNTVQVSAVLQGSLPNQNLQVTVTYRYAPKILPTAWNITGQATMRMEDAP